MSASIYTKNPELNRAVYFVAKEFFYLYVERRWNGTLEFYNGTAWEEIKANDDGYDGKRIPAIKSPQGYTVYIRGKNNSCITGYKDANGYVQGKQWKFLRETTGEDDNKELTSKYPDAWKYPDYTGEIYGGGNLKYLIDYGIDDRSEGSSPITLQDGCFAWMFFNYSYPEIDRPYKLMATPALPSEKEVKMGSWCYYYTFYQCNHLIKPPKLPNDLIHACFAFMFSESGITETPKFPTVQYVPSESYFAMFQKCPNLTFAHNIESKRIGSNGCTSMFNLCEKLIKPPKIAATEFDDSACSWMFYGCTRLIEAPYLANSDTGVYYRSHCFEGMFAGCTLLKSIPKLEAFMYGDFCCSWMFMNCPISKNLTQNETYPTSWVIIKHGNPSTIYPPLNEMFQTGSSPEFNIEYYLHKDNYIVKPNPLD